MECIDPELARALHGSSVNPYTQALIPEANGTLTWRITAVGDDLHEGLLTPLQQRATEALVLRQPGVGPFEVTEQVQQVVPLSRFADIFHDSPPTSVRFRLLTPTAFRQRGRYVFVPDARLILQSLALKHSQLMHGDEPGEDIIEEMDRNVSIGRYNLRSQYFHVESHGIPGMIGDVVLHLRGALSLRAYIAMLAGIAEFSGVGIKTSMGMGAVDTELRSREGAGRQPSSSQNSVEGGTT